jgi:DNA repair exonuclease SbcCD ATPase subunit
MSAATISVDEFLALEQKVLQTVELIKKEREGRTQAESARYQAESACSKAESDRDAALADAAELRQKLTAADEKLIALDEKLKAAGDAQNEIAALHDERNAVRQRVEKMLATMDSLL